MLAVLRVLSCRVFCWAMLRIEQAFSFRAHGFQSGQIQAVCGLETSLASQNFRVLAVEGGFSALNCHQDGAGFSFPSAPERYLAQQKCRFLSPGPKHVSTRAVLVAHKQKLGHISKPKPCLEASKTRLIQAQVQFAPKFCCHSA